jgi:hypothetical protein
LPYHVVKFIRSKWKKTKKERKKNDHFAIILKETVKILNDALIRKIVNEIY